MAVDLDRVSSLVLDKFLESVAHGGAIWQEPHGAQTAFDGGEQATGILAARSIGFNGLALPIGCRGVGS